MELSDILVVVLVIVVIGMLIAGGPAGVLSAFDTGWDAIYETVQPYVADLFDGSES